MTYHRYDLIMMKHFIFSLRIASVFFVIAVTGCGSAFAESSYFDMTETRSENLTPFIKWTDVKARFDTQRKIPDDVCDNAKFHPCDAITAWKSMLAKLQGKKLEDQMNAVNDWSNEHPYILDSINWGVPDYWETPYEFMTVSGDCEDYAISKYYSLRALGVPENQMRIIIVQDNNLGGILHSVLGVYIDDEMMILDNQAKQIIPALKIYHYRPIYGVNEDWWWAYSPRRG